MNFVPWIPVILIILAIACYLHGWLKYACNKVKGVCVRKNDESELLDVFKSGDCVLLDGIWGEGKTFYYDKNNQRFSYGKWRKLCPLKCGILTMFYCRIILYHTDLTCSSIVTTI
jgi:hypothetical protein